MERPLARTRSTAGMSAGRTGVPIASRKADAAPSNRMACAARRGSVMDQASPSRAAASIRRGPNTQARRTASVRASRAASVSPSAARICPFVMSTSARPPSLCRLRNTASLSLTKEKACDRSPC